MEQLTFKMCQIGVRHIICLNNDKLTLAPLQSKKKKKREKKDVKIFVFQL